MENSGAFISRFGREEPLEDTAIDLTKGEKIKTGGSCCDAYIMRHHRRKVFVKRLKEEFQNSSLHLAALDKEFEVGVNLNHVSLPRYLEKHGDFLMMDFIDGKTLSTMIKEGNAWLKSEKNIWKILKQLVEAIEYLHNHHVVHCDIKPDNIMLTAEENRLILIDLDKCHTDWLDDTSGTPFTFGMKVETAINSTIDYKGIGLILDILSSSLKDIPEKKFNKLKELCLKDRVDVEKIKTYIDKKLSVPSFHPLYIALALSFVVLTIVTGYLLHEISTKDLPEDNEVLATETIPAANENTTSPVALSEEKDNETSMVKETSVPKILSLEERKHRLNKIIEKEYPLFFTELLEKESEVKEMIKNDSIPMEVSGKRLLALYENWYEYHDAAMESLKKSYPEYPEYEINEAVVNSGPYLSIIKSLSEITLSMKEKSEQSSIITSEQFD